jgi:DNA modification methylase
MSSMFHGDCLHWLDEQPEASFEAIITDPPYGLKEYSTKEQTKLRKNSRSLHGWWFNLSRC